MAAKRKGDEEAKRKAAADRARKAEEKRTAAAEKKRVTAEKKRLAAEEKKRAAEEKKRAAEEKKRAAEEKKRLALARVHDPELFVAAVTKARTKFHQLVKLADLTKHVETSARKLFLEHWGPRVDEGDVPSGVGTLLFTSGRSSERRLFLLHDVLPSVEANVQPGKAVLSKELPAELLKEHLLSEFDRLNEKSGGRYYVSLSDLRAALPEVSRGDFDATLNDLRRDWVLTLSPAEGRHEVVPQHILDAGILEQSRLLVYVSRRET